MAVTNFVTAPENANQGITMMVTVWETSDGACTTMVMGWDNVAKGFTRVAEG